MFQISTLTNGIRVATARLPTRTVLTAVFTNVGARHESVEENGLSHFLEHMAFKGTTTRDAKTLSQTVERLGCDFNAFTSHSTTAYMVRGLSQHTEVGLEILSDIMQNSVYDEEELVREQDVVKQEIHQYDDDIQTVAWYAFSETAYPDQPIGRSILGPSTNIDAFTRDMVKDYFDRHYHAGEMAIISVGDVDHESFVTMAERYFHTIKAGQPNEFQPAQYVGGSKVLADNRFEQAHVFVGLSAPGNSDSKYPCYDLMAATLGGGMSSPLFYEVREKLGLCYHVSSSMAGNCDHSLFTIAGSTTPENLEALLKASAKELKKLASGDVDPVDFERALNTILFNLASRDEKPMNMIQYAARGIFRDGTIESTDSRMARYQAVTLQDIIEAAQTAIRTPLTVTVAGNVEDRDYTAIFREALEN